jgi:hypothetical protein
MTSPFTTAAADCGIEVGCSVVGVRVGWVGEGDSSTTGVISIGWEQELNKIVTNNSQKTGFGMNVFNARIATIIPVLKNYPTPGSIHQKRLLQFGTAFM